MSNYKAFATPEELISAIRKGTNITLGDDKVVSGVPRLGYIRSNIKGVYYVVYCDSCNARCRKSYATVLNTADSKVLRFLCGKCAGKRYERRYY